MNTGSRDELKLLADVGRIADALEAIAASVGVLSARALAGVEGVERPPLTCTGARAPDGALTHDGATCPIHEEAGR